MKLCDLAGTLEGETVTIVAAGPTTVDYSAIKTRFVMLVNHALTAAPMISAERIYHVSLHSEVFGQRRELGRPNVIAVYGQWAGGLIDADARERAVLFAGLQFPTLDDPGVPVAALNAFTRLESNELCHVKNSSHCAIHFAWLLGCRRLEVVGATPYRGRPKWEYDARLNAEYSDGNATPMLYTEWFQRFVGIFPWDDVSYRGY